MGDFKVAMGPIGERGRSAGRSGQNCRPNPMSGCMSRHSSTTSDIFRSDYVSREWGPCVARDALTCRPARLDPYTLGDERASPTTRSFMDVREVTNMHQKIHHDLAILRLPQVAQRTGLSRSTLYQYIKDGEFPRPVPLGLRAVGWLESEIIDWIASRVKLARDGGIKTARL
jgi:prophage regulatory protein